MVHDLKFAALSLYRSSRRHINLLPTPYLRQFFRLKLSDDIRSLLASKSQESQKTKLRRFRKDRDRIESANAGNSKALGKVLDIAYGRVGKLRWEILEPILTDPTAGLPERIIPAVEKSRPAVYSPELTALLVSSASRPKPATKAKLVNPPTLPERANPDSEEARLLGPFSKRRKVNILWRFFALQWKKAYPPLQVTMEERNSTEKLLHTDTPALARMGVRPLGLQNSGLYEEAETLAGSTLGMPTTPRREGKRLQCMNDDGDVPPRPLHVPRFMRRRFQSLLSKIPVLTYSYGHGRDGQQRKGKYTVSLSANAARLDKLTRITNADQSDLEWLSYGTSVSENKLGIRAATTAGNEEGRKKK